MRTYYRRVAGQITVSTGHNHWRNCSGHKIIIHNESEYKQSADVQKEGRKTKVNVQVDNRPAQSQWESAPSARGYQQ